MRLTPRPHRRAALTLTLTTLAVLALIALDPDEAEAGFIVGVDLDTGFGVTDDFEPDGPGFGGFIRLGYSLPIPLVQLTGETRFGFMTFPAPEDFPTDDNFQFWAALVGGRAGFGGVIGPSLYFHIGYGEFGLGDYEAGGLTWDAGLSLDFTLLPLINLGAHVGYVSTEATPEDAGAVEGESSTLGWVELGAHVELEF